MKWFGETIVIIIIIILSGISTVISVGPDIFYTTAQRIANYKYPVETHEVQTSDGYLLTIFRIPHSRKESNSTNNQRPIVFLQHGILSSSDVFILNGPDNALAYLLADAGFDVWLGNNRGNTYGRKHVNISADDTKFWNFSFNEIGMRDLPAMIDYVLHTTNQEKLHYVGHSQGTTIFFVLMSVIPSYNSKIKTAHMLAPVVYLDQAQTPIALIGGPLLGHPSIFSDLVANHELLPDYDAIAIFGSVFCVDGSWLQWICADPLFITGGWDPKHLNYTLLPLALETHPAGTSTTSFLHFFQLSESGYFRKYDYEKEKNNKIYGQDSPPNYNLTNVVSPVRLYYGDNDYFSSLDNIKRIEKILPNIAESYNVPVKAWNHFDFVWAIDVKKYINDKVIKTALHFEKTKKQL
ncbi:lipase 3-like [Episyrphus balteatus]|uniref:lipase 3-like n=1 Tax=Episyrphus balteatus TaxID=286459 RepID=UPI002486379A|nr:lipase 3-like [Episyrphus balteatus]